MSEQETIQQLAGRVTPSLVSARHVNGSSFIQLPVVYPSGSFVTVCLSSAIGGIRVSDAGFAYREIESFGAGRSFGRHAKSVAEMFDVEAGRRAIFADVPRHDVEWAIFDVSAASRLVVERIMDRINDDGDVSVSDALRERLDRIFPANVSFEDKIDGASSTEWDVTAIAKVGGGVAVFQAVSKYPVSVYKASTAFHDLAALAKPPALVAVVASKKELGSSLPLLSQAARVIEIDQADEVYKRAAS